MKPRLLIALLLLVFLFGTVTWVSARKQPARKAQAKKNTPLVVTTAVKQEDLLITMTQTGVVAAKNSTPVIPEISGRVQWACENGIIVKEGEEILRMDPTRMEEQLHDLQVRYDDAVRRQTQAATVQQSRMKEMTLRLQRAQDDVASYARQQDTVLQQMSHKIAYDEQELIHRREDLEAKKRMLAKGLVAETEVEREQTALKAAEHALDKAKSELAIKRTQVEAEKVDRERNVNNTNRDMSRTRNWTEREVRMSGNEVDTLKLQLDRAKEDLTKTVLKAPVGGLVMLTSQGGWRGETRLPRLGDWVSQGREVATIISLARMEVNLELDQTQITKVRMGQSADVIIDALSGKVFKGKIASIGQTARRPPVQGWMGVSSTTTFPVTIDLPPTGKDLIRPGMRANVRVVSQRIPKALLVPSSCVFQYEKQPVVYVERDGSFVRTRVTAGKSNGDYTAITKGVKAGDRIALNDLGAQTVSDARSQASKQTKEPRSQ